MSRSTRDRSEAALRIACLVLSLALVGRASADGDGTHLPVILDVAAPGRLPVGTPGEIRLTYRAPQANVVAVVQAVEDLDARRATRQREFGVIARAFGREVGELTVSLSFGSPGWKRVTLILVTDEREESEPAVVEVLAIP